MSVPLVDIFSISHLLGVSVRQVERYIAQKDDPLPVAGTEMVKGGQARRFDLREVHTWSIRRELAHNGLLDKGVKSLDAERARLAKNQADKAELDLAEKRGELVRVGAIAARWGEICASVRAKLLSLPAKLAPQVATPDKAAGVQELLTGGVHEALKELERDVGGSSA